MNTRKSTGVVCRDSDWRDRPNAIGYWSGGILLLGLVLLGWLLVSVLSGWITRLRG